VAGGTNLMNGCGGQLQACRAFTYLYHSCGALHRTHASHAHTPHHATAGTRQVRRCAGAQVRSWGRASKPPRQQLVSQSVSPDKTIRSQTSLPVTA
jgi:hypothetical protein